MKRILSLITACILIISLFGCGANGGLFPDATTDPAVVTLPTVSTEPPTEPTVTDPATEPTTQPVTDPTTEPTEPIVVYDLPMTAISITEQTETLDNAEGNVIFEYTYQNIRLILPDGEMSMTINLDILNRIDSTRSAATQIMNTALTVNPVYPYSYSIIYTPMRTDGTVLSLFGQQISYAGGTAIHMGHGLTYDVATGKVLTLEDVLVPGVTADVICPLVIDALSELPEEYYVYSDYSETVEYRFSGNFLTDEGWHLSAEGLCFTFAPYEVAPSSSGFIHAMIPYEKLAGILDDKWFPEEKVTPNGTLEALPFVDSPTNQFDQFAELILDGMGGSYLLHSTGLIYDLVIESGYWNMDGTVYTPEATVFRAGSLVSSDAIRINTHVPDVLPNLRITYTGEDGTVTVFLSLSGEDGSPLLLTY